MATIKSKEQFFEPDPASQCLAPPIEVQYEHVLEYCGVHTGVPEAVRSYFNTVLSLWLYGWLYYPFYTAAVFLSATAVELALRESLPKKLDRKGRDRRGLRELLQEAKIGGLLRDEGFPSLERRRAIGEEMKQYEAEILGDTPETPPEVPYVDVLVGTLPWIRNRFAHPEMHAIMTPGQTLDALIVAAEIINQLWPKPSSE